MFETPVSPDTGVFIVFNTYYYPSRIAPELISWPLLLVRDGAEG